MYPLSESESVYWQSRGSGGWTLVCSLNKIGFNVEPAPIPISQSGKYAAAFSKVPNARAVRWASILGVSLHPDDLAEESDFPDGAFRSVLARLLGLCEYSPLLCVLGTRFRNRIILLNYGQYLREILTLMDPPLCAHLEKFGLVSQNILVSSVFACSCGDVEVLGNLWEDLLEAPPYLVLKIASFAMVETRDLILHAESQEDVNDILQTCTSLIDFNSIVSLAKHDIGIEL